ncbi:MAG: isochorismatase family protein [Chloroherpetonaceae bacterium]|nr:isochorismatase family protein [Chthonomonadaceae bacterium]MDW8206384.1 isochorismatase family protein [Chloroherpetonaceae bacterium]
MSALQASCLEFMDYLTQWKQALPEFPLHTLIAEAGGPERVGIFCVDLINGFCHSGPLASERVRGIIAPIVDLFSRAHAAGVRHFVLTHDAHPPDAAEFEAYPPHCLRDSDESEIVPELLALPFASTFVRFAKNSLHSGLGTGLDAFLDAHPEITHRIVVGDCTDLCTYQLAMHLKLRAHAANTSQPVILPASCVDTYDLPVQTAVASGAKAHPAELMHLLFLYHMGCNGVRVVQRLT